MAHKVIPILILLSLIVVFQFLPSWFFLLVSVLILSLFILIPIYNYLGEKRLYEFIGQTLIASGYERVSIKKYQAHFGVYFKYKGETYYAKCAYGDSLSIKGVWLDGSPSDIVKRKVGVTKK